MGEPVVQGGLARVHDISRRIEIGLSDLQSNDVLHLGGDLEDLTDGGDPEQLYPIGKKGAACHGLRLLGAGRSQDMEGRDYIRGTPFSVGPGNPDSGFRKINH